MNFQIIYFFIKACYMCDIVWILPTIRLPWAVLFIFIHFFIVILDSCFPADLFQKFLDFWKLSLFLEVQITCFFLRRVVIKIHSHSPYKMFSVLREHFKNYWGWNVRLVLIFLAFVKWDICKTGSHFASLSYLYRYLVHLSAPNVCIP